MNFKKIATICAIVATMSSGLLPITTYAAQTNVSVTQKSASIKPDQKELNRLSAYVKLNSTSKKFEVLSSANVNLTKTELNLVNESINKSNQIIVQAIKNPTISVQLTVNNTVKIEQNVTTDRSNTIGNLSINKSANWDYEMHWWGPSIFLSYNFVHAMSATVGNTATYFAGGATAKALENALVKAGMASGPAGWIGLAAGGEIVYDYDCIVSRCSRTGVFVDVNWLGGPNIYSA